MCPTDSDFCSTDCLSVSAPCIDTCFSDSCKKDKPFDCRTKGLVCSIDRASTGGETSSQSRSTYGYNSSVGEYVPACPAKSLCDGETCNCYSKTTDDCVSYS